VRSLEKDQPVITLINVPPSEGSKFGGKLSPDIYTKVKVPTGSLAAIHGALRGARYENVQTFDPRFNPNYGQFTEGELRHIANHSDVLGTTSMTRNREVTLDFIRQMKEYNPELLVVSGGASPTFEDLKWLKGEKTTDIVVRKEGEIAIIETLEVLRNGGSLENVKGLSFMNDGVLVRTEDTPYLTEEQLSTLPKPYIPDYILRNTSVHIVNGTRGCYGKCEFCSVINLHGNPRRKTDERIIEELKDLRRLGDKKPVFFADDNFAPFKDREKAKSLLGKIIENGLNDREYFVQLDAVTVNQDPEFVKLAVKAGIRSVFLGIESFDEEVLKGMKKQATVNQNKNAIKIWRENGVYVHVMTVVGSKNETPESIERLRNGLIDSGANSYQIFAETPLPGSELGSEKEIFPLAEIDSNLMDGQHVVSLPPESFRCVSMQKTIFDLYKDVFSFRHLNGILPPLKLWLKDPKRALQLMAVNTGVRVYAKKMFSLAIENDQYTIDFMAYLEEVDKKIAEGKIHEIFNSKKAA